MSVQSLFVKEAEVAKLLGHDVKWLRANSTTLEAQYGLPEIDPAIGLRHREAIEEWARERNTRKAKSRPGRLQSTNQEDQNGF
ncbi:hypothetical protein VWZ88_12740 [Phaeobacter sp. JH20_36]|uniref:hypothetical protein n=1 Tax=Phaeobacter TaxID=302485 RepID=UPI00275DF9FF|nr:hypothetical protein [Phaeobacter inhibens]GLO70289.1 hypothetical protein MACH17_18060 [Phaeobacter inhibens]